MISYLSFLFSGKRNRSISRVILSLLQMVFFEAASSIKLFKSSNLIWLLCVLKKSKVGALGGPKSKTFGFALFFKALHMSAILGCLKLSFGVCVAFWLDRVGTQRSLFKSLLACFLGGIFGCLMIWVVHSALAGDCGAGVSVFMSIEPRNLAPSSRVTLSAIMLPLTMLEALMAM